MRPMETRYAQTQGIRTLALPLAGLSLLVVVISAYLRLEGAGLGCAEWPACYGRLLTGGAHSPFGAARALHRMGGTLALLLAGFVAWRCWRPRPVQPAARHATLLLLLMLALAALGIWSADPNRLLVNFLNILGGLGLVSLSWRVVLATRDTSSSVAATPSGLLPYMGLLALSVTVVMGALIGASYAAPACTTLPDCNGAWWPSAEGLTALNPFVRLTEALMPGDVGGTALHLLHRFSAVATFLLLGTTGFRALRQPATRKAARVVLLLLTVEVGLGGLTVLSGFGLWLAIGHGACAAVLLAAVATLLRK